MDLGIVNHASPRSRIGEIIGLFIGPRRQVRGGKMMAALLVVLCLLYTSPSPRDRTRSRMPSSA